MLNFEEYDNIFKECKRLSRQKNSLYGCENLKLLGGLLILARMNDKISRLNAICEKNIKNTFDENFEDTLKDLINYSIYYIMLKRKKLEKCRKD